MSVSNANLGGVADPRLSVEPDVIGSKEIDGATLGSANPAARGIKLFDPSVTFEEYFYFAALEREYEKGIAPKKGAVGFFEVLTSKFGGKKEREEQVAARTGSIPGPSGHDANHGEKAASSNPFPGTISDEEWHRAARAGRTATWGAVFYLITTDILGPYSVPWAFSQLGYGPGVALYFVFAVMATVSGYLLWKQFLGLDSSKYPVTGYGDLAFRIYGSWARHIVNILQSLQFFLNVCLIIVSGGQGLAQLAVGASGNGFICFVVAELVFTIAGCLLGQIRTLQSLGHLANLAIWLNLFIIFMTMGITSSSEPNWDAVIASGFADEEGPIYHYAGTPPDKGLTDQINGLMQAVFSYGGATLFMNLVAEMRRPWDFWKGLITANIFIFLCYLIFGLVVYSYQGQATFNPAYQGINPYTWQTVGNVFALITLLIAAVLYGNIGIKVLYANIGREFFRFPSLESRGGKLIWIAFVPGYWILAFIIAAAVPQVSYLSAFVGAAFILQFSYTFPPALMVGYNVLADSLAHGGGYDPTTGQVTTEHNFARYWRGFKAQLVVNTLNTLYTLGAVVTAILGIYASIVGMHKTYSTTQVTAFTCTNPAG